MNPDEAKIIEFLKNNGPSLPSEIKTAIGKDLILTGAILADLVARKIIKISYGKIGGSNLYYLPGQEEKLDRLYEFLKPPEKEVYDILKEKKIILESELSPLHQIAITKLKDFAKPIIVEYNNKEYKFWKWYLLSDGDTKILIEEKLTKNNKDLENSIKKTTAIKEITKQEIEKETQKEKVIQTKEIQTKAYERDNKEKSERDASEIAKTNENQKDKVIKEKPKEEKAKEDVKLEIKNNMNNGINKTIINLKITHKLQLKQWLENKKFIAKKVLLNSKGFAIVEASQDLFDMVIGYHEKRKVTENDLLLFYGYCEYSKKPGILLYETSLNSKAQEILKNLPIKIVNVKNKLKSD